jgi:hypothetical protein
VPIFTELGQDLIYLAHKANTQSDIFLWDRRNFFMLFAFCSLGAHDIMSDLPWLKYWPYGVLISCWKILAHSPHPLNAAKVRPKNETLKLYPGYEWSKKPSHTTVPLKREARGFKKILSYPLLSCTCLVFYSSLEHGSSNNPTGLSIPLA